jgi:hypothetical protein
VGLKKTRGCGKPVQCKGGAWSREVQGKGERGEGVGDGRTPSCHCPELPVRLPIGVPTTAGT